MRELGEKAEIEDSFPDNHLMDVSQYLIAWFPDFANYIASDLVPSDLTFHQRKKSIHDIKSSFVMILTYIGFVPMGLFVVVYLGLRC